MGIFDRVTGLFNNGTTTKSDKIKVEITPINGTFTLNDFIEFIKMKLSSSEDIQEMVIIGAQLLNDKESTMTKMLMEIINFTVSGNFTTSYILTIKKNDVSTINVIISDNIDESMSNMLNENKQIVRVRRGDIGQ